MAGKTIATSTLKIDWRQRYQAIEYVLASFEGALNPIKHNDEAALKAHRATGAYEYIPLYMGRFLDQLEAVRLYFKKGTAGRVDIHNIDPRLKFIDVGCGIGTKVAMAHQMGFEAHGVEIGKKYVEAARQLTGDRKKNGSYHKIFHKDAFKFDFSPYDVIYFYCPQHSIDLKAKPNEWKSDLSREKRLENHLVECAKPGTIFLVNMAQSDHFNKPESRGECIAHNISVEHGGTIQLWVKR